MTWNGLWVYDGTEIINSERLEKYADGEPWFRALPELDTRGVLGRVLDETYSTPQADNAPWYDEDAPESARFYGLYPLNITGVEASTRLSSPFESTTDGGVPGRVRHGIRSVVFQVALMGGDQEAVSYGMAWLRRALLGAMNSRSLTTQIAEGLTLDYLDSKPDLDPDLGHAPIERAEALSRHLYSVTFSGGPTDPQKRTTSCGSVIWITTFTATVGNPFEYGDGQSIFTGVPLAPEYAAGVETGQGAGIQNYTEVDCSVRFPNPIYDPLNPPFTQPPQPASIPLGGFTVPAVWKRYRNSIPASEVPEWGQVVPTIDLYTTVEQRGIRFRFYQDIDGDFDVTDDPCNYVGDMVVSYVPAGATLRIDGVRERIVIATSQGLIRRADTLVFGTNAKPFQWPSITAGVSWVMCTDFADSPPVTRPSISLTLTPRAV